MPLRIVVDMDLCQGHGVCEAEAPDVFEVNRNHKVEVLDPSPDPSRRSELDAAVKYCPTHALSVVED